MTSSVTKCENYKNSSICSSTRLCQSCVGCHIRYRQRPLIFYIWNAVKKKPRKMQRKKILRKREANEKKRTGVLCRCSLWWRSLLLSRTCSLLLSAASLRAWSPSNTRTQTDKCTHTATQTLTYIHMYIAAGKFVAQPRHTRAPLHSRILSYICKVHRHQGAARQRA